MDRDNLDSLIDIRVRDILWDLYMKLKFGAAKCIITGQVIVVIFAFIICWLPKQYNWISSFTVWTLLAAQFAYFKLADREYKNIKLKYEDFQKEYEKMSGTDKKTDYYDNNGIRYQEGDIVFNPLIGDYWTVRAKTANELEEDNECKYMLVLNDNVDDSWIDLNEPGGFYIVSRKNEIQYNSLLSKLHKVSEEMAKEIESLGEEDNEETETIKEIE